MKKTLKNYLGVVSIWLGTVSLVCGFEGSGLQSPIKQPVQVIAHFGQERAGYNHQGIDVVAPMYTPLYAVADGIVTKAAPDSKGVDKGGGHMIFIDHLDGTSSWYMHLSEYGVSEGDRVQAGQWIGLSGASGEVTGPHLHFEYRMGGVPIDPYFIFGQNPYTSENFESYFKVEQQ